MFDDLNDDNFLIYAAKAYDKPHIITSEFEEDLKRLKYVKRLLRKYRQTGDFKERLILNHVIILSNVFGVEPTVNMLFFKVDPDDYPLLKTILIFLNYMPKRLTISFNKYRIRQEEILVDLDIADKLRNLQ
jgi:pilus assembly protein TadC